MCRIVFALGWHRRYSNAIGWHRSKTYKANNAAYRNRFDRYTAPPEFKLRNTGVFFGPFFSRKDVFSFYRIGNCKLMVVRNLPSCFSHLPTISPEAVNWHNAHLTTHSAESPTKRANHGSTRVACANHGFTRVAQSDFGGGWVPITLQ